MKTWVIILLLALVPLASAITSDIKPIYQPSETMIIKISGLINEPIDKEDVVFKRRNVQMAFEYDIKKLGEDYYLYAVLNNEQNNYTLTIKNVSTYINGTQTKIDFQQEFAVAGQLVDYNVKPALFVTNDTIEFEVFSNLDNNIEVPTTFGGSGALTIKPGLNTFKLSVSQIQEGLTFLEFGPYVMPVLVLPHNVQKTHKIKFYPNRIDSVILYNNRQPYIISLVNYGEDRVTNVFFNYDEDLFSIYPEAPNFFEPNKTYYLNLSLKTNRTINKNIVVNFDGGQLSLPVVVNFTTNASKVKNPAGNITIVQGYYCEELSGKVCSAGTSCSEKTVESLDTKVCCTAQCVAKTNSYAWLGYVIGIGLILVLIFFGFRYMRAGKSKSNFSAKIKDAESI